MPDNNLRDKPSLLGTPRNPVEIDQTTLDVEPSNPDMNTTKEEDIAKVLMSPLVARITASFQEAETSRLAQETQWIANLQAYRAEDAGKRFRESEEHTPYVRTTTVKTRAAYSHIMESIMQNSRFPLMVEPTPVPEGAPLIATNDQAAAQQAESQQDFGLGFPGDGQELAPGATAGNMKWKESDELYAGLNEGRDKSGGQFAQLSPAGKAAEAMTKIMLDQLEESNAHTELRKSVFEACLLGSGIMKGVFTEEKTMHRWVEGEYAPIKKKYPKVEHLTAWDLYIDPNAMVMDDAEWVVQRHRMTRKQMRDLKAQSDFKKDVIERCINSGANYTDKSFEHIVREEDPIMNKGRLWEVFEYWGYMTKEEAEEQGLAVAQEMDDLDQIQVNVWICGTDVLRAITNPFLPAKLPYFMFNYEIDPYSIYGTGVPETMEDMQKMMNGFARLAVDNLALAGNLVFDVDETVLVPGQSMDIYPGKVFRRQGGQSGTGVNGIKFPSTANENMMMFKEFRQMADEATGIPSVSHGQTGVSGTGRTSSGLSMILENASLNIKTVIRNIDDDLLQPLGRMLFYWNNQFNSGELPQGDYDVIATGIRSYTKQEVKVQRLQTLLGLVQNPALAPMVKMPYIIRELVKGMDLNPDEVINDMDEAKIYAELIGMAGGAQGGGGGQPQAPAGLDGQQGNTEGAGNPEGANGMPPSPMGGSDGA